MLNDLMTYGSILLACWMAWRYLRRSIRAMWGKVMSWQGGTEPVPPVLRAGFAPPKTRPIMPVLPQQNQAPQSRAVSFEDVSAFLRSHNLTDEQAIELFALARRAPHNYFQSANKIRDAVGGADAPVKSQIAALRPKPPTPKSTPSIRRPQNGW